MANAFSTELARVLDVDRVSLVLHPSRPVLATVSDTPYPKQGSTLADRMRALAKSFCRSREGIVRFEAGADSANWPPEVVAFMEECRANAVAVFPIRQPKKLDSGAQVALRTTPRNQAVLLIEMFSKQVLPNNVEANLLFLAPHIENCCERIASLNDYRWLWPILSVWRWLLSVRREYAFRYRAALLALGLLVFSLLFIQAEYRVSATGVILPIDRANIFVPWDAEVLEIFFEDGALVDEGVTLALLKSEELELNAVSLNAQCIEKTELVRSLASRMNQLSRFGDEQELLKIQTDLTAAEIELTSLQTQAELANRQLTSLTIRAPRAGAIAAFNLADQLIGKPVNRGERLFQICNTSSDWELELKIEERHAGYLQAALQRSKQPLAVDFILLSDIQHRYHASLVETSGRADEYPNEGVLIGAQATVHSNFERLPVVNSEVHARICCGRQPLYRVVFGDVIDFLSRYWFF